MGSKKTLKRLFVFGCVTPATLLVLFFIIYPTFEVFRTSLFKKANFVSEATYAGWFNFEILLKDKNFIVAMQNTVLYVVLVTLVTLVLAILFATLLTRESFRFKSLLRVIFYIPNILSMVVIVGIWSAIYQSGNGLLNSLLDMIGLSSLRQQWLGEPSIINYSLIVVLIWQAIGYYMVMYMSSMTQIPEHLYEAAALEGSTKVQQFFMITLPLIWNNIRTTLTFFIISTINLSFVLVNLTTKGNHGTEVGLNYMFSKAYAGNYGFGMAIGVCIFLFSFILSAIINKLTEREVYQY